MKRILTIAAVLFGFTVAAVAQPKSVGLRLGAMEGAVYQHEIGGGNFIELGFGYNVGLPISKKVVNPYLGYAYSTVYPGGTLNLTGCYNFMIFEPQWTSKGEWGFYAGPGISLGTGFQPWKAFSIGVMGQVGLEYTFWFPLQLSVDLRPTIGIMCQEGGVIFDKGGLLGFAPSISARYTF
ncbi:MAG: hypothetical protein IJN02_11570 [Bacteroidales bacterium]|nr:hypothetical protein [Bacteroidales bacterium]